MVSMATTTAGPSPPLSSDVENAVRRIGARLFAAIDKSEPPSVFSKKGFYGSMMDWAMRDEKFKTQLF